MRLRTRTPVHLTCFLTKKINLQKVTSQGDPLAKATYGPAKIQLKKHLPADNVTQKWYVDVPIGKKSNILVIFVNLYHKVKS